MTDRPIFTLREAAGTAGRRAGLLATSRWQLATPAIVPVGPLVTAGSLTAEDLRECGIGALGVDWLRLLVRQGVGPLSGHGEAGRAIGWPGPLVAGPSDWAFNAAAERRGRVGDELARVVSPIDGSTHELTPAGVVEAQAALGLDVAATLDWPDAAARGGRGADLTRRRLGWAERSLASRPPSLSLLAGVPLDGPIEVARELGRLPFDGFVLAGLDRVPASDLTAMLLLALAELPADRLRVADWRGGVAGLVRLVEVGIDLVRLPAEDVRARRGEVLVGGEELLVANADWLDDPGPLDPTCRCPACRQFSRAYVRHLVVAEELLAPRLIEAHNLWVLARAVKGEVE